MAGYNSFSDHDLVVFLIEGKEAAFAELYNRYKGPLYLHAYRMLQNEDEAKDIVQEMFAYIWFKRNEIVVPDSVDAYLYSSVRNRILNFIAHQKVIAKYVDSLDNYLEQAISSTDEKMMEKELLTVLQNEIALLPPKMREVFELSRHHDLSHKQIADQLNISDKTVKKQVSKAIRILRLKINMSLFLFFSFFP